MRGWARLTNGFISRVDDGRAAVDTKRVGVSPADPTSLHVAGSREGRGRSQM